MRRGRVRLAAGTGLVLRTAWGADRWRTVFAFGVTLVSTGVAPISAIGLKLLVNGVVRDDWGSIGAGAGVVTGALACGWLAGSLVRAVRYQLREKITHTITLRLASALTGIPGIGHFERPEAAADIEHVRKRRAVISGTFDGLVSGSAVLAQLVVTTVLLAQIVPWLALFVVGAAPAVLFARVAAGRQERLADRQSEADKLLRHLYETGTEPRAAAEVRIAGLPDFLVLKRERLWAELRRERRAQALRLSLLQAAGGAIYAATFLVLLLVVVGQAVSGRLTVGDVVAAVALAGQARGQLASVQQLAGTVFTGLAATGRALWLTEHARDAATAARATVDTTPPNRLRQGIRFAGVSFGYGDVTALDDVTLFLPAASIVAVVGDNGAGKSTLVKLLARFHEPDSGAIEADGVDLRRFDPAAWRASMSAAFQDFTRFQLPVRQTIGVGDLPAIDDEAAVRRAIGWAGADATVAGLPDGLDTLLGPTFPGGVDLSGGQWQQLALARAMMRPEPLVLLLDEPTANLDAATERALFDRYMAGARRYAEETGAIALFVTHRFSTVRAADLIVVLDQGRVLETGTHEELLAKSGRYAELYALQVEAYR